MIKQGKRIAFGLGMLMMLCGGFAVEAESILTLNVKTDRENALYERNEPIAFSIEALRDGVAVDGVPIFFRRTGDDGVVAEGYWSSDATHPVTVKSSMEREGFVRLEAVAVDEAKQELKKSDGSPIRFDAGAAVAPKEIQSYPEPADFDEFWAKQRANLSSVPLEVLERNPVACAQDGFEAWDIKVACAGKRPVSGYLVMPKNAEPKSLSLFITFMGYSPVGLSVVPQGMAQFAFLQINAHGIENGFDEAYYQKKYGEGELAGYGFHSDENVNPENSYFLGMMLRAMRAADFMKSLNEWNGTTLMVSGGSQGGFQAVALAALDPAVTQCYADIPWMCDLGGVETQRLGGWRPEYVPGLGYFDTANFAKRVTIPVETKAGMGDYVCPPSGVMAYYNNLKGKKKITFYQGGTHAYCCMPGQPTLTFEKNGAEESVR